MKTRWTLGVTLAALSSGASALVLYDNTKPGDFPSYANADGGILFDDVMIPVERTNNNNRLYLKQIEVQVFAAVAGTYRVRTHLAQVDTLVPNLGPTVKTPITDVSNNTYTFAANEVKKITIGNGTDTLLQYNVEKIITVGNKAYYTFFLGLQFNSPLENIGWVTGDGPDFHWPTYYEYSAADPGRNGIRILNPPSVSSFWKRVSGNPVPEPGTMVALGVAFGVGRLARRRSRR